MTGKERSLQYVSEVTLTVRNLGRSREFYQNVLGFKILNLSADKMALTADGETILVTLEENKEAAPRNPRETGLYHIAFLLPSRLELATMLQHLLETRAPLEGAADHLVSEALYLSDPDGNGLEIYADRPYEEWVWHDGQIMMSTDPLRAEELLELAKNQPWEGLPSGTILGHLHLQVAELEQIQTFYIDGLGFDLVCQFGRQALFISTGGYHHHIGLNTWNSLNGHAPTPSSIGLQNVTISFPNTTTVQETIGRLEKLGFTVSNNNGRLTTRDPSGNTIRLVSR